MEVCNGMEESVLSLGVVGQPLLVNCTVLESLLHALSFHDAPISTIFSFIK